MRHKLRLEEDALNPKLEHASLPTNVRRVRTGEDVQDDASANLRGWWVKNTPVIRRTVFSGNSPHQPLRIRSIKV